jgi:hypothetical protein
MLLSALNSKQKEFRMRANENEGREATGSVFRRLLRKGEGACSSMQPPQPSGRKLRLLVVGACLFLGFVLIRLPINAADTNSHRQQLNTTESLAAKPARKGGAVRLADVPAIPVNHKSSGAMKQVIACAVMLH